MAAGSRTLAATSRSDSRARADRRRRPRATPRACASRRRILDVVEQRTRAAGRSSRSRSAPRDPRPRRRSAGRGSRSARTNAPAAARFGAVGQVEAPLDRRGSRPWRARHARPPSAARSAAGRRAPAPSSAARRRRARAVARAASTAQRVALPHGDPRALDRPLERERRRPSARCAGGSSASARRSRGSVARAEQVLGLELDARRRRALTRRPRGPARRTSRRVAAARARRAGASRATRAARGLRRARCAASGAHQRVRLEPRPASRQTRAAADRARRRPADEPPSDQTADAELRADARLEPRPGARATQRHDDAAVRALLAQLVRSSPRAARPRAGSASPAEERDCHARRSRELARSRRRVRDTGRAGSARRPRRRSRPDTRNRRAGEHDERDQQQTPRTRPRLSARGAHAERPPIRYAASTGRSRSVLQACLERPLHDAARQRCRNQRPRRGRGRRRGCARRSVTTSQ